MKTWWTHGRKWASELGEELKIFHSGESGGRGTSKIKCLWMMKGPNGERSVGRSRVSGCRPFLGGNKTMVHYGGLPHEPRFLSRLSRRLPSRFPVFRVFFFFLSISGGDPRSVQIFIVFFDRKKTELLKGIMKRITSSDREEWYTIGKQSIDLETI